MSEDDIVIVGGARTPQGSFQGELKDVRAPELGSVAIRGALEKAGLSGDDIDEVIMGCVLPAGLGQAPARQAALGAGIPESAGATTINKMCGSGMKATMFAHDLITAGSADIMVAGGLESMTNAPYLLDRARGGYRMGHGRVLDHMFLDGLEDTYEPGRLMGTYADQTAQKYQFTREMQDEFAIHSLTRAITAQDEGVFDSEIVPVTVKTRKGELLIETDEQPRTASAEKIPSLKPAFSPDGTVTAANASSISDGAAALVLTRRCVANDRGLNVLATIRAHATNSLAPSEFTVAPIGSIEKVLAKTGWSNDDVGLYEINEAFAVVTMAAMKDVGIPHEKVNVYGGACALGHPVGATGARIIVTLINAMQRKGVEKGIASLCIGGGEATAVAIEMAA